MPYHATLENHGEQFTFDRGGRHEKVNDNGQPTITHTGSDFVGFQLADEKTLCASKRAGAALFADVKNYINATGDTYCSIPMFIYKIDEQWNIDLSDAAIGDFNTLQEVRYLTPSKNPVDGQLFWDGIVPQQAVRDVGYAYIPPSPHLVYEWAEHVIDALEHFIDAGDYIVDSEKRPNTEAYQNTIHP